MVSLDILNSKAVKRFVRSSFVLIGLFVALSFGFASLVLFRGGETLVDTVFVKVLVCVVVLLAIILIISAIAFFIFIDIVKPYNKNISWVVCTKNGDNRPKAGVIYGVCPFALVPTTCNTAKDEEVPLRRLEGVCIAPPSTISKECGRCPKNKILWVGDEPKNTSCERKTLEFRGITIEVVSTIEDALKSLTEIGNYIAVVYAKNNNSNDAERKTFFGDIRKNNPLMPIFIKADD